MGHSCRLSCCTGLATPTGPSVAPAMEVRGSTVEFMRVLGRPGIMDSSSSTQQDHRSAASTQAARKTTPQKVSALETLHPPRIDRTVLAEV